MKAKACVLVCLFVGITTMSVNAQGNANKSDQGWFTSTYVSQVYCGDELVDYLEGGEIRVHYVFKIFKNGQVLAKEIDQIKGTVTSQSGEVFNIRETDKWLYVDHWELNWHYNLIGDQGTHYIGTLTYNYQTGELTVGKTVCH